MSISVQKDILSPLELYYNELKKQAVVDRDTDQARNSRKEQQAGKPGTRVVHSSGQAGVEDPLKRKPSQPVTPDEKQALRGQLSIYV